eukprot:CAMPEP_0174369920 /NCGR_PEP_ID=MMETSP0811_2-20130205/94268_1 /TAXON_ID=73025 ORGANISM="Eutreptiella gymnastica-like, Strain CCMP1594" /NCGR_SAMPLE_ID=MMETSP0811_2 /ASSEMBLY_ACC=CAM_ASM_000667 /LENGTH=40 /DNA_ID= /DNA_START= /DNA_END= /DNA_ORIENTATION=
MKVKGNGPVNNSGCGEGGRRRRGTGRTKEIADAEATQAMN